MNAPMIERGLDQKAFSGKLKNRDVFALASTDGFTAFPENAF